MIEVAANRRTGIKAGQCSLFESSDSNGWSVCFVTESADSAACAGHYKQLKKRQEDKKINEP